MGYFTFSDSRRNWASTFWAATAIPLVLDPWNPIWDESGWWEEQFGAALSPLGPSGGNYYFTPNFFGRGVARRRLSAEVLELHQKFPLLLGAPVVPEAQIWSSKKIRLGPPLTENDHFALLYRRMTVMGVAPLVQLWCATPGMLSPPVAAVMWTSSPTSTVAG